MIRIHEPSTRNIAAIANVCLVYGQEEEGVLLLQSGTRGGERILGADGWPGRRGHTLGLGSHIDDLYGV